MIIYSEILGKPFNSVEECLNAEKQHNKKLQEEEARRKKEAEEARANIRDIYNQLVAVWTKYIKALTKAGYDVDSLEDKALIFMEAIIDAENRQAKSSQS